MCGELLQTLQGPLQVLNVLLLTLFLSAELSLLEGVAQDPRLQGEPRQGMLLLTAARKIE